MKKNEIYIQKRKTSIPISYVDRRMVTRHGQKILSI